MGKKSVAANVVRAWGRDNLDKIAEAGHKSLGETARGRLHPEVVTAFNRAHKGQRYEVGTPSEDSVIVQTLMVESANGRKTPRQVKFTASEAREVTGYEKRGRLPNSVKEQAAQSLFEARQAEKSNA